MNQINNEISVQHRESYGRTILKLFIDDTDSSELILDFKEGELWPAWLLFDDDTNNDGRFLIDLIENRVDGNHPILLCPDDMDFWCTIIVADVEFIGDKVLWKKIGSIEGKYDISKWRESGLMRLDTWTDEEFRSLSHLIPNPSDDTKQWEKVHSEFWGIEEYKRLQNYMWPFFNDDRNIKWLSDCEYSFNLSNYDKIVKRFIEEK